MWTNADRVFRAHRGGAEVFGLVQEAVVSLCSRRVSMLVQARVERKDIAMTPWEIKAKEFVNCNCAYGCPCQFNALPTQGQLRGRRGHGDRTGSLR